MIDSYSDIYLNKILEDVKHFQKNDTNSIQIFLDASVLRVSKHLFIE
tara:strand:- start:301 stop:441 length:141 start_codon:yes stop_codon:yes gene_type:complete